MVFIWHVLVTALLLFIVGLLIPGIDVRGWKGAILGALVLGLVNAFVRPLVVVLTLPVTVLTLGLFLFVVNALMLMLVAAIVDGFEVKGFGAALLGSVLLTVLNLGVDVLAM